MSKVHITLVGAQAAPVYNGIIATQPDIVVYIFSTDSVKALERLRKEITISEDKQDPLDTTNPQIIIERATVLAEKYKNDNVTINISSGLKSWSHLFGRVFDKYANAEVVYMDQNNVLWNYQTMTNSSDFVFDMHVLFRLYGNSLENNYTNFTDYTEEDKKACQQIELIRNFNVLDFNTLLSVLDNKKKNILKNNKFGTFEIKNKADWWSGSCVEWMKKTANQNAFVRIFLMKKNGQSSELKIECSHAIELAFNSGWFEYKVASLLSKWDRAKELCLNCHFPLKPKVDKNEVDIIINTGPKLLFVECKTQITNSTDIDKFNSVVKTYGGMGSKALFVTDAPMNETAKEKCQEYGMMTFSLQDPHLGISNEKALQLLLDSELFNINTK